MNNQEAYDIVCKHLLSMKEQSKNEEGTCTYRGPNNGRCAIGALIPDELYNETFERYDIENVLRYELEESQQLRKYFDDVDFDLLIRLQGVHDADDLWGKSSVLCKKHSDGLTLDAKQALLNIGNDFDLNTDCCVAD